MGENMLADAVTNRNPESLGLTLRLRMAEQRQERPPPTPIRPLAFPDLTRPAPVDPSGLPTPVQP
jgi:hypothetical protein